MTKREKEKQLKDELNFCADRQSLPEDLEDWAEKVVFSKKNYMFFHALGHKKYIGSCQACKNTNIILNSVKSGELGTCPICGQAVKFRNIKFSPFINDSEIISVFEKMPNGYVLKNFKTIRRSIFLEYKYNFYEMERCFVDNTFQNEKWFHHGYDNSVWFNNYYTNMNYSLPMHNFLYNKNLEKIIPEKYKYCELVSYSAEKVDPIIYLKLFNACPQVEFLVKSKLYNLLNRLLFDCSYVFNSSSDNLFRFLNFSSKNIKDFLGIHSKIYFNYILNNDPSYEDLIGLQFMEKINLPLKKEYINLASAIAEAKLPEQFSFLSFFNYMLSQNYTNVKIFISDYNDYYYDCIKLAYNMKDTMFLKPHNLREAHSKASHKIRAIQLLEISKAKKLEYKHCENILKGLQKLEYSNNDFSLLIPKTPADIIKEGEYQCNCVGSYIERVVKNKSIIAFIRKNEDIEKSFYTVELNPHNNKIIQCRDYKNTHEGTPSVNKFLQSWLKEKVLTCLA